jgi:hypothetical protein
MKRLLVALSLVLLAGAAHAFDPTPGRPRIGVLRAHETFTYERESLIQKTFHDALHAELRERGFEVYEIDATFDELSMDPDRDADWYVEVIPASAETVDYGGVGVGTRHADVTLGVLVSRVAAEVHVYRGRTLEKIASESLAKKNTALLPTSVGVGGRNLFAAIALPFIERAQVRGVARSAARELAARVTKVVREQ